MDADINIPVKYSVDINCQCKIEGDLMRLFHNGVIHKGSTEYLYTGVKIEPPNKIDFVLVDLNYNEVNYYINEEGYICTDIKEKQEGYLYTVFFVSGYSDKEFKPHFIEMEE